MRSKELIRRYGNGTNVVEKRNGICGIVKYVDKNNMIRIELANGCEMTVSPELLEVKHG